MMGTSSMALTLPRQAGERPAVDLLHRRERQGVDDDDVVGQLEGGEAVGAGARSDAVVGGGAPGSGTTTATPISPHVSSGRGTTATAATPGASASTAFDLRREDVLPAPDVHLPGPADEAQPARLVDPAEVAGAHAAVRR